jgi:hypothetical protein
LLTTLLAGIAGCDVEPPVGGLDGPDRPLDWTLEPLFEVGGVAAAEWATFGDIAQVLFDETGRLHVLDASAKLVTIVDVDGSFVGTVGGAGDGPGDVGRLMAPGAAVTPGG